MEINLFTGPSWEKNRQGLQLFDLLINWELNNSFLISQLRPMD